MRLATGLTGSTPTAWVKVQAGRYSLGVKFGGGVTGTVTIQTSLDDGITSFGNLADASGTDFSFTATGHKNGVELPTCKVRVTPTAVTGSGVDFYLQPIQLFPGTTGYE